MKNATLALAVTCIFVFGQPSAFANKKEQASALFTRGNEQRQAGNYKRALGLYQRAYKLFPSYKIGYNVALCQEKLQNYVGAYRSYHFFMQMGAAKSPKNLLLRAKRRMAEISKKIALVKVNSDTVGAIVKVNGAKVGETPLSAPIVIKAPLYFDLIVEKSKHAPFWKLVFLSPGQNVEIDVNLKRAEKKSLLSPDALFKKANELRKVGKYKEALKKYKKVYKQFPNYKIGYNVALTQDDLKNYVGAYISYRYFVKDGAKEAPENMLQNARRRMEALREKIVLVKVNSNVSGAAVLIGGSMVGKTPLHDAIPMKPQKRVRVRLEADGYFPFQKVLFGDAGHKYSLEAKLIKTL